jgi:hypothetical protein
MNIKQAREILALDIERDYDNAFAKGVLIISKYAKGRFNYNFGCGMEISRKQMKRYES